MSEIEIVAALSQLDLYPIDHELTEDEINKKWKLLIKYYHPDINHTAAFQDGEKAKKVNSAHDFIIENLRVVNAYIRKINNIKSEEDLLKEKQEAERTRKAQEEAKRKAEEEAKRKAQEEAKRKTEESKSTYTYNNTSSNSSYNSNTSSTKNTYNTYYKNSYQTSYSSSDNKSNKTYEETKLHKIIMFVELAIAVICCILSIAMPTGRSVQSGGYGLYLYILCFAIPVIVICGVPQIRKLPFVIAGSSFFLFATILMTCGLFA